ncbi:LysM peptidoglycan-binding domain-containing protein [Cellulomonas biazotea]|uniref:LysM peptidoglycan-binding domain-containing protein n=1 Tax=Cellulomonas biazotea TaxID=1709 RepID=UPI00102F7088|nr:LysM peptidoglycan-binding domain-containing protein [Cellulomonas biazotea]
MTPLATSRADGLRRAATGTGTTLAIAAVAVTATGTGAHADDQYTVRSGDTVSHIAARHSTTVGAVAQANALTDASRIRIGQVLTIPTGTPAVRVAPAATAAPAPAAASYTVRSGDTVSRIASRHGTTTAAIVAANGLDSRAFIRIGQTLTVPGAGGTTAAAAPVAAAAPTTTAATHMVASGETVSALATRYGTTTAAIVAANGLDSRAFIRIGQKLSIPGVAPAAATSVGSTFAGRTYPETTVAAANANLASLRAGAVPSKADMRAKITATAQALGVDPALALAVAYQESGFNHAVVSPANAIGTMQVIPSSGQWASELVGRQLNLLDPDDNVTAGVAILRSLVRNAPDLPTAIAGYYQGASSVKRNGMFADTQRYVANVQAHMTRFA